MADMDTVLPALAAVDADARPVVDTSPSNGLISREPTVKRWGKTSTKSDPSAGAWGDIHYYNYADDVRAGPHACMHGTACDALLPPLTGCLLLPHAQCEEPANFPNARFVSEHGFQSFPSFRAYANVSLPEDWSRESTFSEFRMRHPDGNEQALAMMRRHFRVPPANTTPGGFGSAGWPQRRLFDAYLWLTRAPSPRVTKRNPECTHATTPYEGLPYMTPTALAPRHVPHCSELQQARCYETAFNKWRRDRSSPAGTMGILYWQLNAIWQGPDWSTLEYTRACMPACCTRSSARPTAYPTAPAPPPSNPFCCRYDGTPRLAHHAVARSFAPLMLSAVESDADARRIYSQAGLHVHLTSDLAYRVSGTLRVELHAWQAASADPVDSRSVSVAIDPQSSAAVYSVPIDSLLPSGSSREDHFLRLSLWPAGLASASASVVASTEPLSVAYHWLAAFAQVELPRAQPHVVAIEQAAPTRASVWIASNQTAAFVSLESSFVDGAFSDGAFTLLPGQTVQLDFLAQQPFDLAELRRGLLVRSLSDTYA